jgi:alpha-tubulin suppressor-like RCC1 family protein
VDLSLRSLLAVVVVVGFGCVQKGEYECANDTQCAPGICGAQGFCAFADTSCPSGYRYGTYAADGVADTCASGPASADGGLADAPRAAADAPRAAADAPVVSHPDAPPIYDAPPPADAGDGCVTELAGGDGFMCTIRSDQALVCWGDDSDLQLGLSAQNYVSTPTPADATTRSLPSDLRHVSAGYRFSCVLDGLGEVWCLGDNYYHECGTSMINPSKWQHVPLARAATQISSGYQSSCALLDDQTIACWGDNEWGALGDGTTNSHSGPIAVAGVANATEIAVADDFACALIAGGGVMCWGLNDVGQLGIGSIGNGSDPPKTPVTALATGAVELAAGGSHACIRDGLGKIWCWGDDNQDELGDSNDQNSGTPVQAGVPLAATKIVLKNADTCAILTDQSLWCWGDDVFGQLGDQQNIWGSDPFPSPIGKVTAVGVGGQAICGLRLDGSINCLGNDTTGELGDSVLLNIAFAQASLVTDAAHVAAGDYHACVGRTGGAAACWGYGGNGELGTGSYPQIQTSPAPVLLLTSVQDFALGTETSEAITSSGGVATWGAGYSGQLGDGMPLHNTAMPEILNPPVDANVVSIASGYSHDCAAKSDGTLWCWGVNGSGELGDGTMTTSKSPVQVTRLSGVLEVGVGDEHTCARTASAVSCWGDDTFGELGGTPTLPTDIVTVPIDATKTLQLGIGSSYSCARLDTGVECWGYNGEGELGNGNFNGGQTPVAVKLGGAAVSDLSVHGRHACVVRTSDGAVLCWGQNTYGQTGDGTYNDDANPQVVMGLPHPAVEVAAGGEFSCARLNDASVWCWGVNDSGQLGMGTQLDAMNPVTTSWTCP